MAFHARNVFGTFGKRAPGREPSKRIAAAGESFYSQSSHDYLDFFLWSRRQYLENVPDKKRTSNSFQQPLVCLLVGNRGSKNTSQANMFILVVWPL